MTLSQIIDFCRRRHNATSSSRWSNDELLQLIEGRAQEIVSIIGLLEETDTSTTTVSGTQAYDIPTDAVEIVSLLYNGEMLQRVGFREWEIEKNSGGTTPSGTPTKYVLWERQVILIPKPDAANTLTFYYRKQQSSLTAATDTLSIPSVLHFRLCDGVIADMAAKDLNFNMAQFYENKWQGVHIPAFYEYLARHKRSGRFGVVQDPDTGAQTDDGLV